MQRVSELYHASKFGDVSNIALEYPGQTQKPRSGFVRMPHVNDSLTANTIILSSIHESVPICLDANHSRVADDFSGFQKSSLPMRRAATNRSDTHKYQRSQAAHSLNFKPALSDKCLATSTSPAPTIRIAIPASSAERVARESQVLQYQQLGSIHPDKAPAGYTMLSSEQSGRTRRPTEPTATTNGENTASVLCMADKEPSRHERMSILQKPPVPLPKAGFGPNSPLSLPSKVESLPSSIRRRIWRLIVCSYALDGYLTNGLISFADSGKISGLPMHYVQPQAIVRLLNRHTISKLCYADAASALFTHVLPFVVSKVCNWHEYEMLEKYVLRGCPSHFVRLSVEFQLFTGPKSAIHQVELRTMVNFMDHGGLATTGAVRIDDSMRDRLQQDGFFVEDKSKPHNQLLTLRRAPEQVLSQLSMDGCIGNLYWWVHAFNDYMLMNRMHWKRMPALMADFAAQMRHWIATHGIAYAGTARFGCLVVAWRECCFDAEQNQSIGMAWAAVKGWANSSYI